MKTIKILTLFIFSVFLLNVNSAEADLNYEPKLKLNDSKDRSSEIKKRDLEKAKKFHQQRTGEFFGASVDFQIGYGTTSPSVSERDNQKEINTKGKGGITFGALLNLNLFGLLNLTTGIDLINKKYDYGIPYVNDPLNTLDSTVNSVKNQYLNIPLNLNYSGMVSEKVGLSFSGGPYFGILLNPENAVNGFKDFDLGLNGILTGNYMLNPFMSVILGTKLQYGGLNNLLSSNTIEKVTLTNWDVFTGLRFGF
ncbi:MAG TPA: outer membrane beta-barrel protein [Ignavibacteria bacterium]|nr:outer membrane beta-barrel protein [Ignavibacteria bacterium]HRJ98111.1 outer membrane beta-barrel protein [Ignavibacteria bacterium]